MGDGPGSRARRNTIGASHDPNACMCACVRDARVNVVFLPFLLLLPFHSLSSRIRVWRRVSQPSVGHRPLVSFSLTLLYFSFSSSSFPSSSSRSRCLFFGRILFFSPCPIPSRALALLSWLVATFKLSSRENSGPLFSLLSTTRSVGLLVLEGWLVSFFYFLFFFRLSSTHFPLHCLLFTAVVVIVITVVVVASWNFYCLYCRLLESLLPLLPPPEVGIFGELRDIRWSIWRTTRRHARRESSKPVISQVHIKFPNVLYV